MLLLGFYLLALVVLGLFGWLFVEAVTGEVHWWRAIVTGSVVLAMLRGLLVLGRFPDLGGVRLDRDEQPELHALVDEVVRDTGLPAPDEIRLTFEVNAAAVERAGMLGLRRGERTMLLGTALMDAVTPDGLRGVIAHELGHHAGGDTRLGALEYRVHESLDRTVSTLGPGLLRWVFRAYWRLVARLTLSSRRRQELAADDAGVRAGGADAFAAALEAIGPAAIVFDRYLDDYVAPLLEAGRAPADLSGGFRTMLGDAEVAQHLPELARLIAEDEEEDPYDSHPLLAVRLSRVARTVGGGAAEPVGHAVTARSLLRDPDAVDRQVAAAWLEEVTGNPSWDAMTWQEAANEVFAPTARDVAAATLDVTSALLEREARITDVIELITDGRGGELAAALEVELESEEELPDLLADLLGAVAAVHLVREHGWRWTVRWAGPLSAVDPSGDDRDLDARVREAIEDRRPAPLRELLQLDTTASPA